jgi:hypothetical protein
MSGLYSSYTTQEAMRRAFEVSGDTSPIAGLRSYW